MQPLLGEVAKILCIEHSQYIAIYSGQPNVCATFD
ncbi:hypothetical protein VIF_003079 [Vibrio cholerae TM 11079-80]|nr:hypothetical protein VIF_003079 [Vibrio cholerae TM 11079-80]